VSSAVARLGLAERIEAAGAAVLLASVFLLDWYGNAIAGLLPGSRIIGGTTSVTGWQAFTSSRWVWLATVVVALGSAFAAATAQRLDGPIPAGAAVLGLGLASSALIVYRIVHHPGPSASGHGVRIDWETKPGIWPGLVAALAIAVGGLLQLRAERQPASPPDADEPRKAPSERPEQAFSGLTVAQPKPGRASEQADPAAGRPPA
jgi:hypothetical protein